MNLATLQRDFRELIAGDDIVARLNEATEAKAGLAVYRNNYRGQLVACLGETFARTRDWLGDAAFREAVDAHILAVRPTHWSLDAYPRPFPATLEQLYPADAEVAEIAWLESDLECAFVAADADPFSLDGLAGIDWDHAILRFSPSLTVRSMTTNASAIWSALSAGERPPAVELHPELVAIIVWRQEFVSCFRLVDRHEGMAIRALGDRSSFGALCASLVEELGEQEGTERAGAMLGQWLREGLIIAVSKE